MKRTKAVKVKLELSAPHTNPPNSSSAVPTVQPSPTAAVQAYKLSYPQPSRTKPTVKREHIRTAPPKGRKNAPRNRPVQGSNGTNNAVSQPQLRNTFPKPISARNTVLPRPMKLHSRRFASSHSSSFQMNLASYRHFLTSLQMIPSVQPQLPKALRTYQAQRMAHYFVPAAPSRPVVTEAADPVEPRALVKEAIEEPCYFFVKFGQCMRGDECRYSHNPNSRIICDRYLKGECGAPNCSFRHETTLNLIPHCVHYLQGRCLAPSCPYLHHLADGGICLAYQNGTCSSPLECNMVHTFVCSEYYNSQGFCAKETRCALQHPLVLESLEVTEAARLKESTGRCKFGDQCFFRHEMMANRMQ